MARVPCHLVQVVRGHPERRDLGRATPRQYRVCARVEVQDLVLAARRSRALLMRSEQGADANDAARPRRYSRVAPRLVAARGEPRLGGPGRRVYRGHRLLLGRLHGLSHEGPLQPSARRPHQKLPARRGLLGPRERPRRLCEGGALPGQGAPHFHAAAPDHRLLPVRDGLLPAPRPRDASAAMHGSSPSRKRSGSQTWGRSWSS